MRVAIIENMDGTHHGQVGVALHEAGALIDVFRPHLGQPLPEDAGRHDALVVFGGEQSAVDDRLHPYLPVLADLMRRFDGDGRAVLGICLGSQVLARGLGAANRVGTASEFGWCNVDLTGDAAADPVLGTLPRCMRTFQWHADTFTLPPGALHLASSPVAPVQAFRHGRATYGMQFHFEASRPVVRHWIAAQQGWIAQRYPAFLSDHPALDAEHGPVADANGLAVARAWVSRI
jgi:GMP synthase-like glutamine amidotransferase